MDVNPNISDPFLCHDLDRHPLAEGPFQKVANRFQPRWNGHDFRSQRLPLRKSQKMIGKAGASLPRLKGEFNHAFDRAVMLDFRLDQFQA